MALKFYNTLTRQKEDFWPSDNKMVRMYSCGPTVYDYAHIGNLRAYIFADILKRTLEYNNYTVRHIENITDVGHLVSDADEGEDKMMKALKREGLEPNINSLEKLAHKYTEAFFDDMKKLNILPPKKWTKATSYIPQMIRFIKKIIENGFAYETDLAVYFDVSKMADYTRLSGQSLDDKIVGARENVEVDLGKKQPADFVLWFKLSGKNKNHTMYWPSPWGDGFPGWHIECSAMSVKELGENIDIHTGGIDHICVHHTNERAQNYAMYDKEVVRFWMHNEFLVIGDEKMAKSTGEFLRLQSIVDKGIDPLSFRYLCLNTHYRQKLQFSWEALEASENALNNLREIISEYDKPNIGCAGYEERFLEAIQEDLNIPKSLGILWELIKDPEMPSGAKKQTILKFDEVLGLGLQKVKKIKIPKEVDALAKEREGARAKKDWKKSDELRSQLQKFGYSVEDTTDGPKIKKLD